MLINRLRFDRAYGRLQDEEGLSLIELMVSLIIVGAVLSALASTIVASLRAISKNQREARAIALQTEMIERFQAIPWGDVGLKLEDDGLHPWDKDGGVGNDLDDVLGNDPSAPKEEQMPVVLVEDARAERFLPDAIETRGEGDFEYTIETHVVWVSRDAEPPATLNDYESKRIVVFVRWDDVDGTPREVQIAAERAPPPEAIGFVDAANDRDGDGVPDAHDNCPTTQNPDQDPSPGDATVIDGFTPPGVGTQCDQDNDGYPEEDRDGDGVAEDVCPSDPGPGPDCASSGPSGPVINSFVVNKQTGESGWATQNRICVSNNDATSADHRIRVNVSNADGYTVNVTYYYWKGSENMSPPPHPETLTANPVLGVANTFDAIIPRNTGKFRPALSTGIEVDVAKEGEPTVEDDNNYTQPIDLC